LLHSIDSEDTAKIDVVIRQSFVKSPYFIAFVLLIVFFVIFRLNSVFTSYRQRLTALISQQKDGSVAKDKYQHSKIQEEKGLEIKEALIAVMNSEKPYLNPELSLTELAQMIKQSPHDVSQVINQYLNQNFSDFVNYYRVEEFKRRMTLVDFSKYTLQALSEKCGFSSKSSFFRAFKKITGKTPAEYYKDFKS
jgi:YesN/AraC family two-component response regulator